MMKVKALIENNLVDQFNSKWSKDNNEATGIHCSNL